MTDIIKKHNLILDIPIKLMSQINTEELINLFVRLLLKHEKIETNQNKNYEVNLIDFIGKCFNKFKKPIKELSAIDLKNELIRLIQEEAINYPFQIFMLSMSIKDSGEPFENFSVNLRRNFLTLSDPMKVVEFSNWLQTDSKNIFHDDEHIEMLNERGASQPNFLNLIFEVLSSEHQTGWLTSLIDKKQYSVFWTNLTTLSSKINSEQCKVLAQKILEETKGQIDTSHQLEFYRILELFKTEIDDANIKELSIQLKKEFLENLTLIPQIFEYVQNSGLLDPEIKKDIFQETLIKMGGNLKNFHVAFIQLFELVGKNSTYLNNVYKSNKEFLLHFILETRQNAFFEFVLNNLSVTYKKELIKKTLNELYRLIDSPSNQPVQNFAQIFQTLLNQDNRSFMSESISRINDLIILFTTPNQSGEVILLGIQFCEYLIEEDKTISNEVIAQLRLLNAIPQLQTSIASKINSILLQ